MTRYLICENAACYFVLEVSNQERQAIRRHPILSACPECGSNFKATCPFSGHPLLEADGYTAEKAKGNLRLLPPQTPSRQSKCGATRDASATARSRPYGKRGETPLAI